LLSYHSSSFLPHISFLLVHYVSFVFYSSPVHLLLLSFPTRRSSDLPHAYIDSNILGFTNVLEACRHNNVKHLIYASSSSVYGANVKMPFTTSDEVNHPVSLYAASKKSNELMAHTYSHLFDLPTTGIRFFTV